MEIITNIGLRISRERRQKEGKREWLGTYLNMKTHHNGNIFMFKEKGERWV